MKRLAVLLLTLTACTGPALAATEQAKRAILENYASIAQAMYEDALAAARELQQAVNRFVAKPSELQLQDARSAWLAARVPYQQTEVYRFGNPIVDGWEGKVNAWPLDEGLIDYVDAAYGTESGVNPLYTANVIANRQIQLGGRTVDVARIDKKLLSETLHEIGSVEANVATGYHAIEFLLWGQDLNGTGPGAGNRPWTDFAPKLCTNDNCARRAQYLAAAADLLVDDLQWMARQWAPGGDARKQLLAQGTDAGLSAMLTGLGSLSYGELAGERMKLGLLLHDPEEEHDCFSDNTHNSHYYDVLGMRAVYLGEYMRADGSRVMGASLAGAVAEISPELDREMRARLDKTVATVEAIRRRAETKEAYDQMIAEGNVEGNGAVQAAIDALTAQTRTIERIVAALGLQPIQIMGSDSLDDPAKVFE
jgi:putative iron-regulated protein